MLLYIPPPVALEVSDVTVLPEKLPSISPIVAVAPLLYIAPPIAALYADVVFSLKSPVMEPNVPLLLYIAPPYAVEVSDIAVLFEKLPSISPIVAEAPLL